MVEIAKTEESLAMMMICSKRNKNLLDYNARIYTYTYICFRKIILKETFRVFDRQD